MKRRSRIKSLLEMVLEEVGDNGREAMMERVVEAALHRPSV